MKKELAEKLKSLKEYFENRPDVEMAFIFGSRATGKNRKFSDLDLGINGPRSLTPKEYISIKNELEDSDIPYRVDLVDFAKVNNKFKKISNNYIIKI